MKFLAAKKLAGKNSLLRADLMRNPSDSRQWFITLTLASGRSYMLADDNDTPIVDADLNRLIEILNTLGFSTTQITFHALRVARQP